MKIGKNLNILHLLSQVEFTGAEAHAGVLIEQQLKDGHQVFVVSEKWHSPKLASIHSLPTHSAKGFRRWVNYYRLRQFLIKNKIDVIHCHSRSAAKHARFARIGLPIACVTTLHGRPHFSWSKVLFDEWGEKLIAICENVQKAMTDQFKTEFSKLNLSRNPFRFERYQFLHKPGTPTNIAIVGRSSGPKGRRTEVLIKQEASKWLSENPRLTIHIVSAKPEDFSPQFLWEVQKLNSQFENRILLYKNQKPIEELYRDFDVVIGSGRVAVESLISGTMTLAFGEYCYAGPMNTANLQNGFSSNFGDIGIDSMESSFEPKSITKDLFDLIASPWSQEEKLAIRTKLAAEFSIQNVYSQVMITYLSAIFKRKHPKTIPVLMYHRVPVEDPKSVHKIYVVKNQFIKQMNALKWLKKKVISLSEFNEVFYLHRDVSFLGINPVILTFDDGYLDNLTVAQPILKSFGFRASLFLLADHNINQNTWDSATGEKPAKLMSLSEKKQLDPKVWDIGSHGLQHHSYHQLTDHEIENQMIQSAHLLSQDLGKKIESLVYPFGHTSPKIADIARRSGYLSACNTDQGGLHIADWPHSIFRVNIFPQDGYFAIWKKTRSIYRRRFFRKHHK